MTKIVKTKAHPLEEFFDIESSSTEMVTTASRETCLIPTEIYDEKDNELELNYQEIVDKALDGYEILQEDIDDTAPQFRARLAEVAVSYLNAALAATTAKAKMKEHKDKMLTSKNKSPKTVNNTMIIDRNDLLKKLLEDDAIDGEFSEV